MPESGSSKIEIERISISATGKFGDSGTGYIEVYHHNWMPDAAQQYRTYLESAYYEHVLDANTKIRAGKGRQLNFGITPSYGNRKTTQYGIVSEAFTQDRIIGIQLTHQKDTLYAGATLFTDHRVGTRKAGAFPNAPNDKQVSYFADRDVPNDSSGKLAGSVKIGYETPELKGHFSAAVGNLKQADADFIGTNTQAGYVNGTNTNKDHYKFGLDLTYKPNEFIVQGEWYQGKLSYVRQTGWSILAGYEPKGKDRAYIRYAMLDNNQTRTSSQYTWDVDQLTLGYVHPITKGVWLEANYEFNNERRGPGQSKVKNDLFFVELFTGF
ncbi:MAG: hypothetical protein SNJ70_09880, partial [Armatimonadota bacterium]